MKSHSKLGQSILTIKGKNISVTSDCALKVTLKSIIRIVTPLPEHFLRHSYGTVLETSRNSDKSVETSFLAVFA
jgi:hypothetical protein